MGRPRRAITSQGYLTCSKGGEVKHISQFYQAHGETWWTDPNTHQEFGKPSSWCISCTKGYQQGRRGTDDKREAEVAQIEAQLREVLGPPKRESAVTGHWDPEEGE